MLARVHRENFGIEESCRASIATKSNANICDIEDVFSFLNDLQQTILVLPSNGQYMEDTFADLADIEADIWSVSETVSRKSTAKAEVDNDSIFDFQELDSVLRSMEHELIFTDEHVYILQKHLQL